MSTFPLNPGQRAVVESTAGRVVVSAGAGSGKTRTLVERFVDRVLAAERAGEAQPLRSVLLITFTDKAAGELIERVRSSLLAAGRADLAREVDDAWISTIHGFCGRIVRRHALELGVDPGYTVLADTEVGLARVAAFEEAATALLDDAGVRELLDTWPIAELRAAVLRAYDTIRSRGRDVSAVVPSKPGDLREALRDLIETTGTHLPRYASLGSSATAAANVALLRERAEAAESAVELLEAGVVDTEFPDLLVPFFERKPARRGSAEALDTLAIIDDAAATVRQAVLDTHAARWSEAWQRLLAEFGAAYGRAKERSGALDFEDLQLLTRRLWAESPAAARRYRAQFREVMIDEFQDTNRLQVEATAPIIGGRACFVGDVQQSIYGFRDADVTLLRGLYRDAEAGADGEACRLTVNYRTHPDVLGVINLLFASRDFLGAEHQELEHDPEQGARDGWSTGVPRVSVVVADKAACEPGTWRSVEANGLARHLRGLVDAGMASPGEIVVLMRATTHMSTYADALEKVGFDVIAPAAGGFYATREVADVRALLRVLANPLDTEGVIALLAGGMGGLSDDALLLLTRAGERGRLWDAIADPEAAGLATSEAQRARLVHATVSRLREAQGRIRLADAILHAAATLGSAGGLLDIETAWPNVRKVARLAADFERGTPADPGAFLRYLGDREEYVAKEAVAGTAVEGCDAVRMMTVHAAKGLEFPVVALADLGHAGVRAAADVLLGECPEGAVAALRGPKELRRDPGDGSSAWKEAAAAAAEAATAEEARVLYVACTRAERALVLSGATDPGRTSASRTMIDRVLAVLDDSCPDVPVSFVGGEDFTGALVPTPIVSNVDARDDLEEPVRPGVVLEPLPAPEALPVPAEMSYTAFALYDACAYRFFAERMLQVRSVSLPSRGDPLAFGSTLHAALELIARGEDPDDARLRALARAGGLPESEVQRLADAVSAARASSVAELIGAGQPEVDFAIRVGEVIVRGTMDLLVRDADRAIVLDYKTGATWDAAEQSHRAQAEVYAYALLAAGASDIEVRFVHVEAGCEQSSFRFTERDANGIRERLARTLDRMHAGDFPRLAAFDERLCADCPVSGALCPVVHPGRKRRHAG